MSKNDEFYSFAYFMLKIDFLLLFGLGCPHISRHKLSNAATMGMFQTRGPHHTDITATTANSYTL